MTEYTVRSLVIICPVDQIDAVDQMAEALGYKAGFSIPLSADGAGEPTHKGLHATARKHFLWLVTGQPCLLYTSPSPRDRTRSRMPSSA